MKYSQALSRLNGGGPVAMETLREALFAQPVPAAALRRYFALSQPESPRAVWDMTLFDLPHRGALHLPPMVVLGAELDQLMPASLVELTGRSYGVDAEIFPGLGHGLMLERDWMLVAQRIGDWLQFNQL